VIFVVFVVQDLVLENSLEKFRKLIPRFLAGVGVILKWEVELFPQPMGFGVGETVLSPQVRNETIIGPYGFHLLLEGLHLILGNERIVGAMEPGISWFPAFERGGEEFLIFVSLRGSDVLLVDEVAIEIRELTEQPFLFLFV